MKTDEALAAEQAVEAKLAEVGADRIRSRESVQSEPVDTSDPVAEAPPEPVEEVQSEAVAAPDAAEPQGDPAAAAVLAKYGNDPEKVAAAYAQLQRKLGEQGNELGQHRDATAEYEARLAALEQQQAPQPQYVDAATADWFDQAVLENPQGAMEWARGQNNAPLFQRGLSTWKDVDPFAAGQYVTDLRLQDMEARVQQQRPAQNDQVELQSSLNQVLYEHPEFVQYAGDIESVIARYPAAAHGLSGGEQEKRQAIETLFALAERDTLRTLALNGGSAATPASATDVVTPTTSEQHPDEAEKPPSPVDEFRASFAQEAAKYKGERAVPQAYVAR